MKLWKSTTDSYTYDIDAALNQTLLHISHHPNGIHQSDFGSSSRYDYSTVMEAIEHGIDIGLIRTTDNYLTLTTDGYACAIIHKNLRYLQLLTSHL